MTVVQEQQAGLRRAAIGMSGALASTLSNMAPVEGIFIVLVVVAGAMGTLTPWAFMLGAVGIALTGWNFAQLGQRIPSAGSYVGFAYHGAGAIHPKLARPAAAFTFYLSLAAGPITIAAVVVFLGSWLQTAASLPNAWWLVIALAAVAVTTPVILRGIAASAKTALAFFVAEGGGLLVISLVILARSGGAVTAPLHIHGGTPGGWGGLAGITFATAVSGFVGWENSAGLAEEIRNPRRVIPVAILGSIAVVAALYLVSTWAAVAGYVHWKGAAAGTARLGSITNAAPFVELVDHYGPWMHWGVIAIGVISPAACYLAAVTTCSRWTFASARGGLLPRQLARCSDRTGVPAAAVVLWVAVIAALCVIPYFLLHGNAVTIAAYEAGIGTVPLLMVYMLASAITPVYIWRHDRATFKITAHLLPGLAGLAVVGYGVYEFVLPSQPPPANTFWAYILALVVLAAIAAAAAVRLRGPAIDRLGHVYWRGEPARADRGNPGGSRIMTDLILAGGDIITFDPQRPAASAVAIADGRITGVGDRTDIGHWRGNRTEVIDLGGATLAPGLVDSHMHPVMGLDMTVGLDLSGCTDLGEVRTALQAAVATANPDQWILGWGLDPNAFGTAPIGSAAIEDVLGGRPACLTLFDAHSALASRRALALAGIDGARRFGSRSAIICDSHGNPTGHLLEEGAIRLVRSVIPPEPFAARRARLAALLHDMAAAGLTGGHVMDLDGDAIALYDSLDADGQLPLRLRLAPWRRPEDDEDTVRQLLALQGQSGRLWSVAAVKLFIDGTVDGGTAWLHEADCHGQSTAPYWQDARDYTEAVRVLVQAGVQTATHAIGDAAVQHVLDTLAKVVPVDGTVRHRIEHIETLPSDQVPRFAELGVVASMQPSHARYTRADHSDNWSRRLGEERADRAWRCRDLLEAGAILTLGSDWPIAPFDPRQVMAEAQLRRPADRPDLGPVCPSQALTALQALHGYTTAPALTACAGRLNGRIAPGYRADLTAFAASPLRTPAADLPEVAITLTIVDGIIRHRST